MTESNNIYSEYSIDINKLTRDYLKFPLKKIPRKKGGLQYEELPKEDVEYLYIECNVPYKVLAQYFNVCGYYITKIINLYNLKKSTEQKKENYKQTCLKLYGVENAFQSSIIKEKMKQTNLEKHGVEYYTQTDECKEKFKQTCLDRFGVENPAQSPIVQEKMKQTCLENYGVENAFQSPIVQEKAKQTNLERYGVENYSQTDERKKLYENEEFVNQVNEKRYITQKKNGSFSKSEEENKIYDILLTKFKEVKRQYKSELYPFRCDFYIPEIDLYIEYQGYFTHGFEPYLGTDEQKEIVKEWENKPQKNPQYLRAIKTWTVRDPQKRNIAKQNNLNWIEFFNMKEFIKWFETV